MRERSVLAFPYWKIRGWWQICWIDWQRYKMRWPCKNDCREEVDAKQQYGRGFMALMKHEAIGFHCEMPCLKEKKLKKIVSQGWHERDQARAILWCFSHRRSMGTRASFSPWFRNLISQTRSRSIQTMTLLSCRMKHIVDSMVYSQVTWRRCCRRPQEVVGPGPGKMGRRRTVLYSFRISWFTRGVMTSLKVRSMIFPGTEFHLRTAETNTLVSITA